MAQGEAVNEVIVDRSPTFNYKAVLSELLACPVPSSLAMMSFEEHSRLPWEHIEQCRNDVYLFPFNVQLEQ